MDFFLRYTLFALFQLLHRFDTSTAFAITRPQSSLNRTIEDARSQQQPPNVYVTDAQNFTNAAFNSSPLLPTNQSMNAFSDIIKYKIPSTPTTLYFHSFGPVVPNGEILSTIAEAIAICLRYVVSGRGTKPITMGYFLYTHLFLNNDEVDFSVADHREDGRPMEYYILADVLRGISEYMKDPNHDWTEVSFEVEVKKRGVVGSGHLERRAAPTSAASLE